MLKYVDSAQEFIAHLGECVAFWMQVHWSAKGCFTVIQNSLKNLKFPDADLHIIVNPEAMATSGKTDKSPHDQEIKFFAKVWSTFCNRTIDILLDLPLMRLLLRF